MRYFKNVTSIIVINRGFNVKNLTALRILNIAILNRKCHFHIRCGTSFENIRSKKPFIAAAQLNSCISVKNSLQLYCGKAVKSEAVKRLRYEKESSDGKT